MEAGRRLRPDPMLAFLPLAAALLLPLAACRSSTPEPPTQRAAAATGASVAAPDSADVVTERIDTEAGALRLVRIVGGLENPWGVAFLPDGRALVTERPGRLQLVEGGRTTAVGGVPDVWASGQGGLLDVVLHPAYASNGLVYLTHAARGEGGAGTRLVRARLDLGDAARPALRDVETLYTIPRLTSRGQHFGSRLAWLPDGTLLMTVGDRGEMARAQDRADAAGSTLRLTADGGIPPDNPFVGQSGVRPELFTYGNRNSQGMAVDPETGLVWQTEHGPQGGDELNLIRAGANYGWPEVSHGRNYGTGTPIGTGRQTAPGVTDPLVVWTPSIGTSGTAVYRGTAFPAWNGHLLVGGLVSKTVERVAVEGERVVSQEAIPVSAIGRVRDVRVGPDGLVYLLTDENPGGLYRLEPAR